MTSISVLYFQLLLLFTTPHLSVVDPNQATKSFSMNQKNLKLVASYEKNLLQDVSSDGRFLLFFQTDVPMRTAKFPFDGSPSEVDTTNASQDALRVVERSTGREVGRILTHLFPYRARFVPGTQEVFYEESKKSGRPGLFEKFWNPVTGRSNTCLDTTTVSLDSGEGGINILAVISPEQAIGRIWQRESGDILVKVSLPSCELKRFGPFSPTNPEMRVSGQANSISVSPDRQQVAFGTQQRVVLVRNSLSLKLIKEIAPPEGLRFGETPIYTPDGRFLTLLASDTVTDGPETKRYLLFLDTRTYSVVRRLDITSWNPPRTERDRSNPSNYLGSASAISPDGRKMAVAFTREVGKPNSATRQAEIIVYDLGTAEAVARAVHPITIEKRNDPFAARVGTLKFTPDGRFLLSSTYDTLIWEVEY